MNAYYVQSGWRSGLVAANSSLHALKIAESTDLHKVGRKVKVYRVERTTLSSEIVELVKAGPGRILLPSLFRYTPLLLQP